MRGRNKIRSAMSLVDYVTSTIPTMCFAMQFCIVLLITKIFSFVYELNAQRRWTAEVSFVYFLIYLTWSLVDLNSESFFFGSRVLRLLFVFFSSEYLFWFLPLSDISKTQWIFECHEMKVKRKQNAKQAHRPWKTRGRHALVQFIQ